MRELKQDPVNIERRELYHKRMSIPANHAHVLDLQRKRRERCREHDRARHREHYAKNAEKYNIATEQWAKDHPEWAAAGQAARRYAEKKDHCETCGVKGVELAMHHQDYSMPLDVITVCEPCHKKIHVGLITLPKRLPILTPNNERHCNSCRKVYPNCGRGAKCVGPNTRGCVRWEPYGFVAMSDLIANVLLVKRCNEVET